MNRIDLKEKYGDEILNFSHSKKGYYTYMGDKLEVIVCPDYRTTLYSTETLLSIMEPEDFKSLVVNTKDCCLFEGEGIYV